jgi:cytochrome oxidase Cu insertion factor (SCO1/SenC/PrrC family)/thiol-disulfide isomerase/thioredoxin
MKRRIRLLVLLTVVIATLLPTGLARADGDPGSDVLVYQNLFPGIAAGLTAAQQAHISGLLSQATAARFPIRVAVIGGPGDLGSITAAWHQPRAYAKFLGAELSLAYAQRLLVVMPNGFGFFWAGHARADAAAYAHLDKVPIRPGAAGLTAATEAAVDTLASDAGVRLSAQATVRGGAPVVTSGIAPVAVSAQGPKLLAAPSAGNGHAADTRVALIALGLILLAGIALGSRTLIRRREKLPRTIPRLAGGTVALGVPLVVVLLLVGHAGHSTNDASALSRNPNVDPGTPLGDIAPNFTLDDEQGNPVSLRSYRGKAVLLAFTDSECTTICPLTTTAMLDAKAMLGAAGSQVQLLGVDANPDSTSLEDVASYTQLHGLDGHWHFLTGTKSELKRVWANFKIEADIEHGLVDHTPALYLITPEGREAKVYFTQQSYSSIGQLGQVVAHEISAVLPSHPAVHSHLSYAPVPTIGPRDTVSLPRSGGGKVILGPGRSAHLELFFATWDQEVTSLAGHLATLNRYSESAQRDGLPPLSTVDEGSVEPSPAALPTFLRTLKTPLTYPVAIDNSGRVADGYEVQDQPWLELTSAAGRIIWHQDVDTNGWPSLTTLDADVRAALSKSPMISLTPTAISRELAGSPAPLAALHTQSGQLLGNDAALNARLHAVRGHPVVLNVWYSGCQPCQAEFGLFANASVEFGRRVAFLGADTNDNASSARAFLFQHPVSYPSYQDHSSQLSPLAVIEGYPTTIFINSAGKVVYVHTGQYDSQGTLDADISHYAH